MRIGELAERAGVTLKAVRYYESRGLLSARRNESGYRDFDDRAVDIVRAIRAAQNLGSRVDDLRSVLEHLAQGTRPCDGVKALIAEQRTEVARRIEELRAFDVFLADLAASESEIDESTPCPILERAASHERLHGRASAFDR